MPNIANNLTQVHNSIQQSAANAKRDPAEVTLLAVSKTKPATDITSAFNCGQRDFGENYLQEALEKIHQLHHLAITWHFIGSIQSNKARSVAENFSWVHTVDRLKIAQKLNQYRPEQLPPLQVCLQVNIDASASKSGCAPEEAIELAKQIAVLPRLQLQGLMTVPAKGNSQQAFEDLAQLAKNINEEGALNMTTLSMGMSQDLDQAIAAGATIVRVGTDIFGARQ